MTDELLKASGDYTEAEIQALQKAMRDRYGKKWMTLKSLTIRTPNRGPEFHSAVRQVFELATAHAGMKDLKACWEVEEAPSTEEGISYACWILCNDTTPIDVFVEGDEEFAGEVWMRLSEMASGFF